MLVEMPDTSIGASGGRLTGPKSYFRGKVARSVSLMLTPQGHAALASALARTGLSRSDYIELLIRRADQHPFAVPEQPELR